MSLVLGDKSGSEEVLSSWTFLAGAIVAVFCCDVSSKWGNFSHVDEGTMGVERSGQERSLLGEVMKLRREVD